MRQALEKSKTLDGSNKVDANKYEIELQASPSPLADLIDVNSNLKKEKSIVIDIFDQDIEEGVESEQKNNDKGLIVMS